MYIYHVWLYVRMLVLVGTTIPVQTTYIGTVSANTSEQETHLSDMGVVQSGDIFQFYIDTVYCIYHSV